VAAKLNGGKGVTVEEVTRRQDGDAVEVRSTSAKIRTVDDLLRHIDADLERFEVAASEATKWEGLTADRATGEPVVTELHRVFVRLRPRGGPGVAERVAAMIAGAAKAGTIGTAKAKRHAKAGDGVWQVLVVADTHFAKYAWSKTTGGDDYEIACTAPQAAQAELLSRAARLGLRLTCIGAVSFKAGVTIDFQGRKLTADRWGWSHLDH
jgi:hypothetical protein